MAERELIVGDEVQVGDLEPVHSDVDADHRRLYQGKKGVVTAIDPKGSEQLPFEVSFGAQKADFARKELTLLKTQRRLRRIILRLSGS